MHQTLIYPFKKLFFLNGFPQWLYSDPNVGNILVFTFAIGMHHRLKKRIKKGRRGCNFYSLYVAFIFLSFNHCPP
jgi:hypothetical protein